MEKCKKNQFSLTSLVGADNESNLQHLTSSPHSTRRATSKLTQSQKLEQVRAPIYAEVIAENPGLTKEELAEMMSEMGILANAVECFTMKRS